MRNIAFALLVAVTAASAHAGPVQSHGPVTDFRIVQAPTAPVYAEFQVGPTVWRLERFSLIHLPGLDHLSPFHEPGRCALVRGETGIRDGVEVNLVDTIDWLAGCPAAEPFGEVSILGRVTEVISREDATLVVVSGSLIRVEPAVDIAPGSCVEITGEAFLGEDGKLERRALAENVRPAPCSCDF